MTVVSAVAAASGALLSVAGISPAPPRCGAAGPAIGEGLTVDPDKAHDVFYGDSDETTAAGLVARLGPMPLVPMGQRSAPAWKSIASTYVVCTNDRAIPVEAQRWTAQRATEVVELPSDHSPVRDPAGRAGRRDRRPPARTARREGVTALAPGRAAGKLPTLRPNEVTDRGQPAKLRGGSARSVGSCGR